MYAVGAIKTELNIEVLGMPKVLPMNWAEGMIGAIPVFETPEQAEAYRGRDLHIPVITLQEVEK